MLGQSQDTLIRELLRATQRHVWGAEDALFRLQKRDDAKYPYQPAHDSAVFAAEYRALCQGLYKLLTETDLFHKFTHAEKNKWLNKVSNVSNTSHFKELQTLESYGHRFLSQRT